MTGVITSRRAREAFTGEQLALVVRDFEEFGPSLDLGRGVAGIVFRFDDEVGGEDGLVVLRREGSDLVEVVTIAELAARLEAGGGGARRDY